MKFEDGAVKGVNGYPFNDVLGWDGLMTGHGGDVNVRLGHNFGVPSLDHNTVSMDEPLRLGRFIAVWLRKPTFLHPKVSKVWDYFLQDKVLEVSGLSDNSIGVVTKKVGAVGREEAFAGNYTESNNKFTIKVPEVKGSPVRKTLNYLITGISDSVTGVGHFHGNKGLRFSKVNYSGDFLYALLGPSMRPDDIEYAAAWFNSFPSQDFISHLNSGAIGDPGGGDQTFDIEFNGTFVKGLEITKLAQIMTEALGYYKDNKEDILLPSYVYQKYFNTEISELIKSHGANIDQKLANMRNLSQAANDAVDTRPNIHQSVTEIQVKDKTSDVSAQFVETPYGGPVE